MIKINAQTSTVLLPQDLLQKAADKYYFDIDATIHCEPYSRDGEPYWTSDCFRLNGRVEGNPSVVFYAQPSWGNHFASQFGEDKVKCVTYACDPEIHHPVKTEEVYDVGFIGNVTDGDGRQEYLDAISKEFKCFISSTTPTDKISEELSKCKVLFNHIRYEEINIRFFESLAIGVQVCSRKPSLGLFATEGRSYLTFNSITEALARIRALLRNDYMRLEMKKNAVKEAQNQTYFHRISSMLPFLLEGYVYTEKR